MLDILVGARCLGKFVWHRICEGQGRVMSAKSAWPGNAGHGQFWPEPPFPKSYAEKFGLAGGRSLALAAPLLAGTWLVETVSFRPSKFTLWRWAELCAKLET